MDLWKIDALQFPRLLAELRVVGLTREQYNVLCEAMDLHEDDIDELFERAEASWQRIKERTFNQEYAAQQEEVE